jgi:hypothetical protein
VRAVTGGRVAMSEHLKKDKLEANATEASEEKKAFIA